MAETVTSTPCMACLAPMWNKFRRRVLQGRISRRNGRHTIFPPISPSPPPYSPLPPPLSYSPLPQPPYSPLNQPPSYSPLTQTPSYSPLPQPPSYSPLPLALGMSLLSAYLRTSGQEVITTHQTLNHVTRDEMQELVTAYAEFMYLKAVCRDTGEGPGRMSFSTSPEVDELWHTHVLCTRNYLGFMQVVNQVSPGVGFIHHSLTLGLDSEEVKMSRREATRAAYTQMFHRDCSWLNPQGQHTSPYRNGNLLKSQFQYRSLGWDSDGDSDAEAKDIISYAAYPRYSKPWKSWIRLSNGISPKPKPKERNIKLTVIDLTAHLTVLYLPINSSVLHLKELISYERDIPPNKMILVFNGQRLKKYRSLFSYGIQHWDKIRMILKLRGC